MEENPALVRHKNLTKQIKWLQKQIQESTKGAVDESDIKFMEKQFEQKWQKGGLGGENKNLINMLKVLSNPTRAKNRDKFAVGLDPRYRITNPKSVYKFLVKELQKTEKYLGTRDKKDRGHLAGISGDGPGSKLLAFNSVNDRYIKRFDPLVKKAYDDEADRAKRDYLRSTDRGPGFDPEAWRKNLTKDNPHRSVTVKDKVYQIKGDALPTTGTVTEEATSGSYSSSSQKNNLSIKGKNNLTGNPSLGDQRWTGRNSGISYHQANANTRALLINEGADKRQVNLLSDDVLSRFRISGAIGRSDRSINLINDDGPMIRLKIRR